ncbi:hypothetical protein BF49_0566 [Bradyrhizobium sp.]|nr:hypothetical protein BF49_0566 [Bradyrhizobium sp.]
MSTCRSRSSRSITRMSWVRCLPDKLSVVLGKRSADPGPLPQGVIWRRLVVISLRLTRPWGIMGPGFRQDDAGCLEAATPHTMPSATTM